MKRHNRIRWYLRYVLLGMIFFSTTGICIEILERSTVKASVNGSALSIESDSAILSCSYKNMD